MTTFEWFLLIVVVIGVPLVVAVVVTLWTLEQARQRNRRNRSGGETGAPVKRYAVRPSPEAEAPAGPIEQAVLAPPASTPVRETGAPG